MYFFLKWFWYYVSEIFARISGILPFFGFRSDLSRFADISNVLNILYLGLGASALCFVTWNYAVKVLGAVKTSIYIYMVPAVTVLTSVLILKEAATWLSMLGMLLTVAGLFLSEYNGAGKKEQFL